MIAIMGEYASNHCGHALLELELLERLGQYSMSNKSLEAKHPSRVSKHHKRKHRLLLLIVNGK